MNPEGRATPQPVSGDPPTIRPSETPGAANQRGGRIDFVSATDLVDQASQESFPASDSPAWTILDVPRTAQPGRADSPTPDDTIDEASEESFPASDPPAWTHMKIGPPR